MKRKQIYFNTCNNDVRDIKSYINVESMQLTNNWSDKQII